ncbi:MAG: PQQ-binding-like beta-propeller repeat protein [Gemmataceae bacterium]
MSRTCSIAIVAFLIWFGNVADGQRLRWPQFRGVGGLGISSDDKPLPTKFGPKHNLSWKVAVPVGDSSPCVWGDFVFLTGADKNKRQLETLCLDRRTGKVRWQRSISVDRIERHHKVSSPATSTPTTDGSQVYVYFGSYGLICYDFQGKLIWERQLPVPRTRFGTGTSPIVVGELVILSCDFVDNSYLLAVDRQSGKTVWKQERLPGIEGYATPVVWHHNGTKEIVLHTPERIFGCSLKDGKELWRIPIKSTACATPVVGSELVFVSTWIHRGEADERIPLPKFAELLQNHDKNKDNKLQQTEFPKNIVLLERKQVNNVNATVFAHYFFRLFDKNKDKTLDSNEWKALEAEWDVEPEHGLLAIKPGGKGNVSKTHVVWKQKRFIPECTSPLHHQGLVYLVREGGLVTCLDAKTGKQYYQQRLGATGAVFFFNRVGDKKI